MVRYEPQIRRQLIEMLYRSILFGVFINTLIGLVVLAAYWPKTGMQAAWWFGLLMVTLLYRMLLYFYYRARQDEISADMAEILQFSGMLLTAVVWAAGPWYFLGRQGIAYDVFLAFVLGGMAAGSIITFSSDRITSTAYLVVMLVPLSLWLFMSGNAIEFLMGILVSIFLVFLLVSSGRLHKVIFDSLKLQWENSEALRAVKSHEAQMELIFDNVPVGIFFYDTDFNIVNVNQYFVQIFDSSRDKLIGLRLDNVKDKRIIDAMRRPIDYNGLEDGFYEGPYIATTSGKDTYIRARTTALKNSKNRLIGAIGIIEDIRSEIENKRQIEAFAQFYIQNPNPVFQIACSDGSIAIENDAARAIQRGVAYSNPTVWDNFIRKACEEEESILDLRYDQKIYQFDAVVLDEQKINLYGRDVTKERIARERADYLAYYDELTGLPRRKLLFEHVKIAMIRAERSGTFNAILFLDLDNFKQINDSMGHDVGDKLLMQMADRLTALMRTGDIVARLGGDEFVILLSDIEGDAKETALKSEIVAQKIRGEVAKPFIINGHKLHVGASVGITVFSHGRDFFDLLKEADMAMYAAKTSGKNSIRIFDNMLERITEEKSSLLQDLHTAVRKNQLTLLYHPQIELATGACIGAEALVRWEHPKRGTISPEIFIPLAEESGLIHEIGRWVLENVAAQMASLPPSVCIAVNVSSKEFARSDFIDVIKGMIDADLLDPRRIELEMTETVFIENFEKTNDKLRQLRQMGFRFSIDDFGTGYSSLAYLKNLSIETLKIDRSFIEDIGINPNDEILARTIIDIARHFGMKTVAEGVENDTQIDFLKKFGCDIVQGYYFSTPITLEAFAEWLARRQGSVAAAEDA